MLVICPTESLGLITSENPAEPPETPGDWVKSFFNDKKTGAKHRK